jgi:multisubunit Na+/H+ antiporter MnhF subunit
MSGWYLLALLFSLGYLPCLWLMLRQDRADALVAVQAAGAVTVFTVFCLALGMRQPVLADLSVALALLGIPGGLAFVHFMERWI